MAFSGLHFPSCWGAIDPKFDEYSKDVLAGIGLIYDNIATARDNAFDAIRQQLGKEGLTLVKDLFGPPPPGECQDDWAHYLFFLRLRSGADCQIGPDGDVTIDGLLEERELVLTGTTDALKTVLGRWKENNAAPQKLLAHVEYFAKFGVRAAVLKIFDVENLRQQITDALALAVPTTRTLKSHLDLPLSTTSVGLGNVPASGPGKAKAERHRNCQSAPDQAHRPLPMLKESLHHLSWNILSIMTFSFKQGVTYTKPETERRGSIKAPLGAEDIRFGDKLVPAY